MSIASEEGFEDSRACLSSQIVRVADGLESSVIVLSEFLFWLLVGIDEFEPEKRWWALFVGFICCGFGLGGVCDFSLRGEGFMC